MIDSFVFERSDDMKLRAAVNTMRRLAVSYLCEPVTEDGESLPPRVVTDDVTEEDLKAAGLMQVPSDNELARLMVNAYQKLYGDRALWDSLRDGHRDAWCRIARLVLVQLGVDRATE